MKSGIPTGFSSSMHKRLYPVLPKARGRSNSASLYTSSNLLPLSFFDSPPPPSPRLIPLKPRILAEPKQHPNPNPNPLALTPPPLSNHDTQLFPYQYQYSSSPSSINPSTPSSSPLHPRTKRSRTRYQLDVGAYGIPKRSYHPHRSFHTHTIENTNLSVQIGEDAYFIRDNAMGIADGVGGWARSSSPSNPDNTQPYSPSPSALFARRLMHFTSAQLGNPISPDSTYIYDDPSPIQSLDSHLEDLEEGIDVLQILEQAYNQTVKAHLEPSTSVPLHVGSSTALVAVLDDHDHSHHHNTKSEPELEEQQSGPVLKIAHVGDCMGMLVRGEEIVWRSEEMWWAFNMPVQLAPPPPSSSLSTPSPVGPPPSTLASLLASTSNFLSTHGYASEARLKPDSKNPSHPPVHVIPTPRNSAQVLTLPVRPDDILILASDGLSDNLWDEDVLDEVVRFRRMMWGSETRDDGEGEEGITTRMGESTGTFLASASIISSSGSNKVPKTPSFSVSTASSTTTPYTSTPPTSRSRSGSPLPPHHKLASPVISSSPSAMASALHRHTLAAMLSEALCSRARRVSERRSESGRGRGKETRSSDGVVGEEATAEGRNKCVDADVGKEGSGRVDKDEDETPFARRAREDGRMFAGGKKDDISVLVAIVAPAVVTDLSTGEQQGKEAAASLS